MTTEENQEKKQRPHLSYWKNQTPPETGKLFTDDLFPPNKNSLLGLNSNNMPIDLKAYNEEKRNISDDVIFVRPKEIFGEKYKLFSETIEMDDVIQGALGDCYFLSAVATLCEFPGLIMKLFRRKEINPDGFYEIMFYIDGKPQIVIIDDYLPVTKYNKSLVYAKSKGNEIWVPLIEKAWAKVNGGYVNIIGGLTGEAFEYLIGIGSMMYDTLNLNQKDKNEYICEIIKNVQIGDKNNCLMSCSTNCNMNLDPVGLVSGHAYSLLSFHQITTSQGKTVYLFKVRNPWSHFEWKGDWSDKSKLWDDNTKKQVNFLDKDDGTFFISDKDFFNYFIYVDIAFLLYDSTSVTYTIEGEENLKNGCVFNIQTEGEGQLSVTVLRTNWRSSREYRGKKQPTHISVVKCNLEETNPLKTFSDYNGKSETTKTCAINVKVEKGTYLIYVYRDTETSEIPTDNIMEVKIVCSAPFKHAQMSYDESDKGFPLLQNIILQALFEDNNYDPDSGEDLSISSNQLRGNGIGYFVYYFSNPGYYITVHGNPNNLLNYTLLYPRTKSTFQKTYPSGKFFIVLGLVTRGDGQSFCFGCIKGTTLTTRRSQLNYDDMNIDLSLYTDIENSINNENFKQRKTQSLKRAQSKFYFEGEGKVEYKDLSVLQKDYEKYIKLLDEVNPSVTNTQ